MTRKQNERISTLEELIIGYQASYYNGEAEISDAEFDRLWDELKQLKPDSPLLTRIGADNTDGFPKARHLIPMGSQDKAANPEDFRAWAEKIAPANGFIAQYKLDGASLELQYENGKLLRALTRGDGVIGDDITRNVRRMGGLVAELGVPFTGGIRGEVLMTREVWKTKYAGKANCRNAANGIMRRKGGEGCEDLTLIVYDAAASDNDAFFVDEVQKLSWLKERGFSIAETREFTGLSSAEDIIAYRTELAAVRDSLPIDIDGLVVKDRDTNMADLRRARPERQIAFKFDLEVAYSVLRAVEWSEAGATYTPVGIIDPVHLAGTTVQRASLNNPDMIRKLGLKIGSLVSVVKRGEIIPKIEGIAPLPMKDPERDIEFPAICGVCGAALIDAGTRLYCPNPDCPKRLLHRLQKWIAVLDIRELGDKLTKKLFDKERVRHISDLYTLTAQEVAEFEHMGELSAAKVVRNIRKKRALPLSAFIAGFDFDGVAEAIMEKVLMSGFDTLEKLRAATVDELASVYGLGEVTAKTIVDGLAASAAEMDKVLAAGFISIAPPPTEAELPLRGVSFCFTGELRAMRRNEAEEKVQRLGGQVKASITKDLSYLVTNDPESGSAKNKKAQSYGIPIIDETAFLAILADPAKAKNTGNDGFLFEMTKSSAFTSAGC
ncbi:MAG: NAD-dependent DNA ligase LigA [Treponema sp.]|jgi:DNA ligase (NAD+)|nr:NAD-dependent DNA ligase LigA [Treponema sp.]